FRRQLVGQSDRRRDTARCGGPPRAPECQCHVVLFARRPRGSDRAADPRRPHLHHRRLVLPGRTRRSPPPLLRCPPCPHIPATPTQVLAYAYLSAVVNGVTLFALSDLLWLIAAFRPDRNSELIQLLNDMAWLIFTAPVGMTIVMMGILALAIFLDAHPRPVFP